MKSLKICEIRKEDQLVPPTAAQNLLELSRLANNFYETRLFRSYANFVIAIARKNIYMKLNHLYPYDLQTDHI